MKAESAAAGSAQPVHTSHRIEEAALELFFERGFKATTMREIAVACGITPGALYNHFPSKDQILYSLIRGVHTELEDDLNEASAGVVGGPVEKLRALVRAHALYHAHSRKEARVANLEIASLPDPQRDEIVAVRRRMQAMFRELVDEGARSGLFQTPNNTIAVNAIINMGIRLAEWFHPDGELSATEVAEIHAELALRMLGEGGGG